MESFAPNERLSELCNRYVDLLHRSRMLSHPNVPAGTSQDELIAIIQKNASENLAIMQESNEILNILLFSRDPALLRDSDIHHLTEFADMLFSRAESEDCGVAYKIHCLLLENARLRMDTPMTIRELYYCGLTLYYLNISNYDNSICPMRETVRAYFLEAASYLEQYEQFDSTTRSYIIRALGNNKVLLPRRTCEDSLRYYRYFDYAMSVMTSSRYRKMNPELPWDEYIYSMHMDNLGRMSHMHKYDADMSWRLMQSAEYIKSHQKSGIADNPDNHNWRISCYYTCALYHYGKASARDVVELMLDMIDQTSSDDYSAIGIETNLSMLSYVLLYERLMPHDDRVELSSRIEAALANGIHYLDKMPADNYPKVINNAVRELVDIQTNSLDFYCNDILDFLMVTHKPTYVHSCMVARLTTALVYRMTQVAPENLVGVLNCRTAEQVKNKAVSFSRLAYGCGKYHDVGKYAVAMYISLNSRRLLQEEFKCIQCHPELGYQLLCKTGHEADYAQAARYHHYFYNSAGGYMLGIPACPSNIKPIVDALSIADALEAATDNIGRSYTVAKSFDDIVKELRAGAGTRYSPAFVKLFDDADFYSYLKNYLYSRRKDIYSHVYLKPKRAKRRLVPPPKNNNSSQK